jgi:septal ring-binding cell division protein DamX
METPPPDATMTTPVGPPERRCPRCGSTLAPEQEWCLACGAAAGTEVAEASGWRVPIYLGGGLVALAVLGVILAIAALSNQEEPTAGGGPSPSPSAQAPVPSPTISPIPTTPPTETITPIPTATVPPEPTETVSPDPTETATADPPDDTSTGTFDGWTGADGDYTIIIESADNLSDAETVAEEAQGKGLTVGILDSGDFSSLNSGYQVVFSGTYSTKSDAEDALGDVQNDYPDAYVRQISNA